MEVMRTDEIVDIFLKQNHFSIDWVSSVRKKRGIKIDSVFSRKDLQGGT